MGDEGYTNYGYGQEVNLVIDSDDESFGNAESSSEEETSGSENLEKSNRNANLNDLAKKDGKGMCIESWEHKHSVRRSGDKAWTPEEEMELAEARLKATREGVDSKSADFWEKVATYHNSYLSHPERTANGVKQKWGEIQKSLNLYTSAVKDASIQSKSACDIELEALQIYTTMIKNRNDEKRKKAMKKDAETGKKTSVHYPPGAAKRRSRSRGTEVVQLLKKSSEAMDNKFGSFLEDVAKTAKSIQTMNESISKSLESHTYVGEVVEKLNSSLETQLETRNQELETLNRELETRNRELEERRAFRSQFAKEMEMSRRILETLAGKLSNVGSIADSVNVSMEPMNPEGALSSKEIESGVRKSKRNKKS